MVGHQDHDRVVGQAGLLERRHDLADLLVDERDARVVRADAGAGLLLGRMPIGEDVRVEIWGLPDVSLNVFRTGTFCTWSVRFSSCCTFDS